MSNKSLSPSNEWIFTFVFLFSIIMAATVSLGRPRARSICSIFPLCMALNALDKSTNNSVASRIFARTPFNIRGIVKICDVVDRFLWKPFWFFLSIYLISGSMLLRSRTLKIFAAIEVRVLSSSWLLSPFFGKGSCSPLSICLSCSGYVRRCSIGAVCGQISLFSILLRVFHQDLLLSDFWFFLVLRWVLRA